MPSVIPSPDAHSQAHPFTHPHPIPMPIPMPIVNAHPEVGLVTGLDIPAANEDERGDKHCY